MGFSTEHIIRRLQEQLQISRDEAENTLSGFVHHIRDGLSTDGRVDVPHFGTFTHDGYTISFEPDEPLLEAVNERYAGLEPETLHTSPPEEEPSEETGAEPPPPDEETSTEETVASLFQRAQEADESDQDDDEPSPEYGDRPSGRDEDDRSGASLAAAAIASSDAGTPSDTPESEPPPPANGPPEKRRRSRLPMALLVLLLLGAGAWLTWEFTQGNMDTRRADNPGADIMPTTPGMNPEGDTTETESAADTSQTAPEDQEPPVSDPAEQQEPPAINPAEGGYSLVVLSTPDEATAQQIARDYASQLSESGIPAGILDADVDGANWYRVGVGQFSSISEAQDALSELAGEIPADAWIVEL